MLNTAYSLLSLDSTDQPLLYAALRFNDEDTHLTLPMRRLNLRIDTEVQLQTSLRKYI